HPENDTLLVNNTITKAFSVFTDELPILLMENLLHQDESAVINAIQDTYPDSRMHRLHYFPILSDSLANLASQRRFFWYGLNSLPVTIGMGKGRINGFRDDYGSLYADLIESMDGLHTFVSSSSCSAGSQEGTESVIVNLELHNARTRIYTSGTQSIMNGSRVFVALARKFAYDGVDRYYLDRFVAFADTTSATLAMGTSLTKTYSFTISGITSGELVANYRLYYWIQGNDGSAIHFVNYMDFEPDNFVTNQDIVNQVPALRVGPNPAVKGQRISVTAKSGGRISIYNLRGQLILRENEFKGTLDLPNSVFPVSGIYLLRFEGKGNTPVTRKISIIK
ncbi:MAG TPA: T9SS type A sorting domain-containing protein, partial [Candidatus Cloacimonadota bacterium]|nr:T9SS type A sorting domain-containing protein [Candidatus Cloacimonadota bacterium]